MGIQLWPHGDLRLCGALRKQAHRADGEVRLHTLWALDNRIRFWLFRDVVGLPVTHIILLLDAPHATSLLLRPREGQWRDSILRQAELPSNLLDAIKLHRRHLLNHSRPPPRQIVSQRLGELVSPQPIQQMSSDRVEDPDMHVKV